MHACRLARALVNEREEPKADAWAVIRVFQIWLVVGRVGRGGMGEVAHPQRKSTISPVEHMRAQCTTGHTQKAGTVELCKRSNHVHAGAQAIGGGRAAS